MSGKKNGGNDLIPLPPISGIKKEAHGGDSPPELKPIDNVLPSLDPLDMNDMDSGAFNDVNVDEKDSSAESLSLEGVKAASSMKRLAVELVLPNGNRLLLMGETSNTEIAALFRINLDDAPVNATHILKGLGELAASAAKQDDKTSTQVRVESSSKRESVTDLDIPEVEMPADFAINKRENGLDPERAVGGDDSSLNDKPSTMIEFPPPPKSGTQFPAVKNTGGVRSLEPLEAVRSGGLMSRPTETEELDDDFADAETLMVHQKDLEAKNPKETLKDVVPKEQLGIGDAIIRSSTRMDEIPEIEEDVKGDSSESSESADDTKVRRKRRQSTIQRGGAAAPVKSVNASINEEKNEASDAGKLENKKDSKNTESATQIKKEDSQKGGLENTLSVASLAKAFVMADEPTKTDLTAPETKRSSKKSLEKTSTEQQGPSIPQKAPPAAPKAPPAAPKAPPAAPKAPPAAPKAPPAAPKAPPAAPKAPPSKAVPVPVKAEKQSGNQASIESVKAAVQKNYSLLTGERRPEIAPYFEDERSHPNISFSDPTLPEIEADSVSAFGSISSRSMDSRAVSGEVSASAGKAIPQIPSAAVIVSHTSQLEVEKLMSAADSVLEEKDEVDAEGFPVFERKMNAEVEPILGIDFGTSYTCAAIYQSTLEVIAGPGGELMMPSVISFPPTGEVVIGTDAKNRIAGEAQWTISSPKRLLGRPYKDPQVASLIGPLAMRSFAGTDQFTRFDVHGEFYSVTDIAALILKEIKKRAEAHIGKRVTKAVFSVPVAFGSLQRSALEMAAKQAGLVALGMVTEPSAALLAHGFGKKRGLAAVYDFGGGTFDFCVVDVSDVAFRVLCAGGDPWLGGDDFDNKLAEYIADRYWKDESIDLRSRAVEWQRLIFECEKAKIRLSTEKSTVLAIDDLVHTADGTKGLKYKISRKDFIREIDELIERSIIAATQIMQQTNVDPKKIDQVVMTGGSSMIPAVRDAVTNLFKQKPIVANSELAVVRGTALRAAELAGEAMNDTSMSGRTLREVAGRTIGISVEGGPVVSVFERDTVIPAEAERVFKTTKDNQKDMIVTLYEGAKSRIDEKQVLGQLRYRGLKPKPAGKNHVEFSFYLDEDGMLTICAVVEGKSFEKSIKLG